MEVNMSKLLNAARLGLVAALIAVPAFAQPGSAADPIPIHMKRGADRVRISGVLTQGADCCAYRFAAYGGQTLKLKVTGAAVRMVLSYPDGHSDGPLGEVTPLPADGSYVLSLTPDTMADGAFGPFKLTLTIPPQVITPGLSVNGDRH
jgi:hypothetical protein